MTDRWALKQASTPVRQYQTCSDSGPSFMGAAGRCTFSRRPGHDAWHWCTNCSNWPTVSGTYEVKYTKPTTGELDNECKSKQAAGTCKTTG